RVGIDNYPIPSNSRNQNVRGVLPNRHRALCALGILAMVFAMGTISPAAAQGNLTAKVTVHSATLTWTASTTKGVKYTIYRGKKIVGNTKGLTYTDSPLAAATTYSYSVTASCVACPAGITGTSLHSNSITVTTPPNGPPPPPPGFAIGARVDTLAAANVRGTAPASGLGTLLGTEPIGALGTV